MDINLCIKVGASLFVLIYLTQLAPKRLKAFGNFLKDVLGVLPITKAIEAIKRNREL